jgi:hypothetical protein
MTLTPIERRLEDATVLFIKAQAWKAAIGLFAELARVESDNANAWFGMGSSLWRLSLNEPQLLEPSVAALKRAVEENKQFTNHTYKQLLVSASQSATKAGINVDLIATFHGDPKHFADAVDFTPQTLIDATRTLDVDSRTRLVSVLSEVPGELVETLLRDLADNDANSSVRTVATRALSERPQKPIAPEPISVVGHSPESALDAAAEESAESPVDAAEPEVTMVDTPAEEVASAIPNISEVIPTSTTEEVIEAAAEAPTAEITTPEAAPKPADPKNDDAIRSQLEARRQRLMGKK